MDFTPTLARRLAAEGIGTALLLAAVVGSGIMGERLAGGNTAVALLANSIATGGALVALILAFGPVSGAHFNPLVTLAAASRGGGGSSRSRMSWGDALAYMLVQLCGAVLGVAVADLMFDLPAFSPSQHARQGFGQLLSEGVATFGLLAVIWGCSRQRAPSPAFAVGAYIAAGYWFTASTAVANPAVAIARSLTDTFSGIRPEDVPAFIAAQIIGATASTVLFRWLVPELARRTEHGAEPDGIADSPAKGVERRG